MNILPPNWDKAKEIIKKEYPHIKDEDLQYETGKEEEMLIRLSEKMKKRREEMYDFLHIMG